MRRHLGSWRANIWLQWSIQALEKIVFESIAVLVNRLIHMSLSSHFETVISTQSELGAWLVVGKGNARLTDYLIMERWLQMGLI